MKSNGTIEWQNKLIHQSFIFKQKKWYSEAFYLFQRAIFSTCFMKEITRYLHKKQTICFLSFSSLFFCKHCTAKGRNHVIVVQCFTLSLHVIFLFECWPVHSVPHFASSYTSSHTHFVPFHFVPNSLCLRLNLSHTLCPFTISPYSFCNMLG